MIIKTTLIFAVLTIAFVILQVSSILLSMGDSDLKSQLEKGGFLKPYVQIEATEITLNNGGDNA